MSVLVKGTLAQTHAVREGIKIVRGLFKQHDFRQGVSTADLYKLAAEVPPPQGFKGDPRLVEGSGGIKGIVLPPNNDHPIRSKVFLKRTILPALVGCGEIKKVGVNREITAPVLKRKKGRVMTRATTESASASPENPITVKAWVWRPVTEEERFVYEVHEEDKFLYTRPPVQAEDISHLNKRRQRSREESKPRLFHDKASIDHEAVKKHQQEYDRRKVEERKLYVSC
ncbi:hypothetical protein D9756_008352 [Leucocoprinus leucothites]|uniref:Uncharacterized protein n=1 Tax=Leucocoprinus leucothites TaxID=201217 RepID=A0A8H5FW51_9AGAR|nr:hypothetical protein D9756_008352 [Leucoagaricus leucothites]